MRWMVLGVSLAIGASFTVAAQAETLHPSLRALPMTVRSKIRGGVPMVFMPRVALDGSRRILAPLKHAPIAIHFADAPRLSSLGQVEALGVTISRRRDGSPRGAGHFVLARATAEQLAVLAELPIVTKVELDTPSDGALRPLEGTTEEIQVGSVRREQHAELPLTGHGMLACSIDSGIDIFHPLFFRADGGYFTWQDEDGSGHFTSGVDTVFLDGEAIRLRIKDGLIRNRYTDEVMFGSDNPAFAPGMDWIYADSNANGLRDHGAAAGYDDTSPSFGERWFVIDDVNGNGRLDLSERLIGLGSSKVRAVHFEGEAYRRGTNLIHYPVLIEAAHGTGSSSVWVGGHPGLSTKTGIAPDADIIMAVRGMGLGLAEATDICVSEGARVVLHEYAPWTRYPLDGSSALEQLIDQTSKEGVAHINPAGNLSTSRKMYKHAHPAGTSTTVKIQATGEDYRYMSATFLWRDPSRPISISLVDPDGNVRELPLTGYEQSDWADTNIAYFASRQTTSRNTEHLDIIIYDPMQVAPIPLGEWKVVFKDEAAPNVAPLTVVGAVADEISGWGEGILFPEHDSEDHLIGHPGTADEGIAVAAYTGYSFSGATPGERAYYSGRGRRIDDMAILSISAPDNPITASVSLKGQATYGIYGGTSGASPHVAGVATLILQKNPTFNGGDVRQAIRDGALADAVVGEAPNEDFGYGKLRAYRSIFGTDPPDGEPPTITANSLTMVPGEEKVAEIAFSDPDEPKDQLIVHVDLEYDGVYDQLLPDEHRLRFDAPGRYVQKLRVTDSTGRFSEALLRIDVAEKYAEPKDKSEDEVAAMFAKDDGGCGCRVPGVAGDDRIAPWWLALLLALGLRRRRGRGDPKTG